MLYSRWRFRQRKFVGNSSHFQLKIYVGKQIFALTKQIQVKFSHHLYRFTFYVRDFLLVSPLLFDVLSAINPTVSVNHNDGSHAFVGV